MTIRMLKTLKEKDLSKSEIAIQIGHKGISGALKKEIKFLFDNKYIELTIPEKPQSRLQKYRITKKGQVYLKDPQMDNKPKR